MNPSPRLFTSTLPALATAQAKPFYTSGLFLASRDSSYRGSRHARHSVALAAWTPAAGSRLPPPVADATHCLGAPGDAADEIKISYRNQPVAQPHLAELQVWCKGRGEIASKDFDKERPLVFEFGAHIIAVLNTSQDQTRIAPRHLATDGSLLRIGPCVVRRGPVLSIDLLTEGHPEFTCQGDHNTLINGVKVRDSHVEDRANMIVRLILGSLSPTIRL